jgi:Zn-dependent M28 family amino/carboxypeptidase
MTADPGELRYHVEFLSGMTPPRSFRNPESLDRAALYIAATFERIGLDCQRQSYETEGVEFFNVAASYNPGAEERLIVGAHYDVFGELPGADDNASAVAGLLETARLITREGPDLDCGIDFVAYTLEEPPFYGSDNMGSAVHARFLAEKKIPVRGMICLEMIGFFTDEPESQRVPYPHLQGVLPDKGNFIVLVGLEDQRAFVDLFCRAMQESCRVVPVYPVLFPADDIVLAGMSDHVSYWEHGFSALMVNDTSYFRNRNYHTAGDTADTLDFVRMADVVDGVSRAVITMASAGEAE